MSYSNNDPAASAASSILASLSDITWQPVEHESTVDIEITGIEIPDEAEVIKVHRVEDDNESVTDLSYEITEDTLTFTTEHFTVFTIGGTAYDQVKAVQIKNLLQIRKRNMILMMFTITNQRKSLLMINMKNSMTTKMTMMMKMRHMMLLKSIGMNIANMLLV